MPSSAFRRTLGSVPPSADGSEKPAHVVGSLLGILARRRLGKPVARETDMRPPHRLCCRFFFGIRSTSRSPSRSPSRRMKAEPKWLEPKLIRSVVAEAEQVTIAFFEAFPHDASKDLYVFWCFEHTLCDADIEASHIHIYSARCVSSGLRSAAAGERSAASGLRSAAAGEHSRGKLLCRTRYGLWGVDEVLVLM